MAFWTMSRSGGVELVDRLAAGEVDIGILAGTGDGGMLGIETPGPVGLNQIHIDHLFHDLVGNFLNLVDFMAGPEAVEEVQEGNPRL
jgi:hypothetical protein